MLHVQHSLIYIIDSLIETIRFPRSQVRVMVTTITIIITMITIANIIWLNMFNIFQKD